MEPPHTSRFPGCRYLRTIDPIDKKALAKALKEYRLRWQEAQGSRSEGLIYPSGMVLQFVSVMFCRWFGEATVAMFRPTLQAFIGFVCAEWHEDMPEDEKEAALFMVRCMRRLQKLERICQEITDYLDPPPSPQGSPQASDFWEKPLM